MRFSLQSGWENDQWVDADRILSKEGFPIFEPATVDKLSLWLVSLGLFFFDCQRSNCMGCLFQVEPQEHEGVDFFAGAGAPVTNEVCEAGLASAIVAGLDLKNRGPCQRAGLVCVALLWSHRHLVVHIHASYFAKHFMDITLFAPSSKVDRANKKNWLIFLSAAKKVHDSLKITPP